MISYSATTVLQPYFPTGIPKHFLDRASLRGRLVHAACFNYASGIPVMGMAVGLKGYFKSFQAWFGSYVDHVFFVEERMEDPVLRYHGQPDLGCRLIDGRNLIVDYKTPLAESPTWKMQIAGYLNLARKNFPGIEWDGGMSLRLKVNGGTARATVYEETDRDWAAFCSALNVYRYIN